jgi:hypothetical protein
VIKRHLFVGLLALLALCHLGACESSHDEGATDGDIARCRALCENKKSCAGADPDRTCTTYCINLDRIIVGGRCRIRYGLLLDCYEALDDLCDAPTECEAELGDYGTCVDTYCSERTEQCADGSEPF